MEYPKNDKELRIYCLNLAYNGSSSEGIDFEKAKKYYEFIIGSSKPSVWKGITLALSRWCARPRRSLRHRGH